MAYIYILFILAIYLLFPFLIWMMGNKFCQFILSTVQISPTTNQSSDNAIDPLVELKAGRLIGGLERLLMVLGIILARWEIIAGVIALKSVTRYKELDNQINAEYFLIGSLASIIWSALMAIAFKTFDATYGLDLVARFANLS